MGGTTVYDRSLSCDSVMRQNQVSVSLAKLKKLIIQDSKPFVLVTKLKTISYDEHFRCYEVKSREPEIFEICELKSFSEQEPLWLLISFERNSITYVNSRSWI